MKDRSTSEKAAANQYDKIFRENIESIFMPLVERSLGIVIAGKKVLPVKIVNTNVREMDSLFRIKTTKGQEFILHMEVQTKDDKEMIYRVSEYHALCLKKYKLPIKHIVIYLGKKTSKMKRTLKEDEIFTSFELLSFNEMNPEQLLASEIPEEVLLTILSDFDLNQSEAIIQAILIRLQMVCENKNQLKKITSHLTILSKLRNLETETVRKIKNMTQLFDITTSILFKEGLAKGMEEGIERGMEEGIEKGEDKGDHKRLLIIIANMITKSPLNTEQIADLVEVEELFVIETKEKLENDIWMHPDTWTDAEWNTYFENKKEDEKEDEN